MSFSTALVINDVDDYITPSKTCIKPVKIGLPVEQTKYVRVESDGTYTAITKDGDSYVLPKATITLNDCLACSGCITTAESVLVSEHSVDAFRKFVKGNRFMSKVPLIFAASISPQSVSSLASAITLSTDHPRISQWYAQWRSGFSFPEEAHDVELVRCFLSHALNTMGAHVVLDTTWARDISLSEAAKEFVHRFFEAANSKTLRTLPVYCSVCPGWVCYAEKANASGGSISSSGFSLASHLSTVRSPQQIAGRLLKQNNPQLVYHVAVMPCFDKKLEASRTEYSTSSSAADTDFIRDVDLVLATNEFVEVLELASVEYLENCDGDFMHGPAELNELGRSTLEKLLDLCGPLTPSNSFPLGTPPMYRHYGTGSGGYAAYVFCEAARQLFHIDLPYEYSAHSQILTRPLHNRDLQEILLFASTEDCDAARSWLAQHRSSRVPYRSSKAKPQALLAFAVANGFRNIQNVVQPLKAVYKAANSRMTSSGTVDNCNAQYPFDYVEVMACPGGEFGDLFLYYEDTDSLFSRRGNFERVYILFELPDVHRDVGHWIDQLAFTIVY